MGEAIKVGEDELVDEVFVEGLDGEAVFVGVADGDAVVGSGTGHDLDARFQVVTEFLFDALFEGGKAWADLEALIVGEGEAGG